MTIGKILIYLSYFSVLVPLAISLITGKFWSTEFMRIISILLVASAFSDATCYALAKMHISNLPVVNTYFVISFALLSIFYSILMKRSETVLLLTSVILSFYIGFSISSFGNWGNFHSLSTVIQSIALVFLGVCYCINLYKHLPTDNLLRFAPMWVNAAILLYYSFNLLLFITANYVLENTSAAIFTTFWAFTTSTTF